MKVRCWAISTRPGFIRDPGRQPWHGFVALTFRTRAAARAYLEADSYLRKTARVVTVTVKMEESS